MPRNGPKHKGVKLKRTKLHDPEVLAWACTNLKVGSGLPMSVIEALAWEHFKDRWGDCRSGFGGKLRRLFPAHNSDFPHRLKDADLFVWEDGLWSLRPGAPGRQAAETTRSA